MCNIFSYHGAGVLEAFTLSVGQHKHVFVICDMPDTLYDDGENSEDWREEEASGERCRHVDFHSRRHVAPWGSEAVFIETTGF